MTKRQTFTNAFKAEVVRLLEQSGKPAADVESPIRTRLRFLRPCSSWSCNLLSEVPTCHLQ